MQTAEEMKEHNKTINKMIIEFSESPNYFKIEHLTSNGDSKTITKESWRESKRLKSN
jgi:hypothetical protein